MAAAEGLLAHVAAWHKEGLQKLTSAVDKHKVAIAALIQQAEAEILELVQPFENDKPRNKRRAAAKQQQVSGAIGKALVQSSRRLAVCSRDAALMLRLV